MRPQDYMTELLDGNMLLFPMTATIQSYNDATKTATILPNFAIKGVSPKPITDVKCVFPAGGQWEIDLLYSAGDEVLVLFCCTNVSLWLQGRNADLEIEQPELHNAIVVGCLRKASGTASTAGMTLRNSSGTISIEMTEAGITIKANPGLITFEGPSGTVGAFTHTHPVSGAATGPPNPGT